MDSAIFSLFLRIISTKVGLVAIDRTIYPEFPRKMQSDLPCVYPQLRIQSSRKTGASKPAPVLIIKIQKRTYFSEI